MGRKRCKDEDIEAVKVNNLSKVKAGESAVSVSLCHQSPLPGCSSAPTALWKEWGGNLTRGKSSWAGGGQASRRMWDQRDLRVPNLLIPKTGCLYLKKCSHGKETEQSRAFSSTALEQTLYYVILCLFLFPPLDVSTFK